MLIGAESVVVDVLVLVTAELGWKRLRVLRKGVWGCCFSVASLPKGFAEVVRVLEKLGEKPPLPKGRDDDDARLEEALSLGAVCKEKRFGH